MRHDRATPGYGAGRGKSFERYYLRNVLSEGCNCAELVITNNELGRDAPSIGVTGTIAAILGRLFSPCKGRSRPDSGGSS